MVLPGLGGDYKRTHPDQASGNQFNWNLNAADESLFRNQHDFLSPEGRHIWTGRPGIDRKLTVELSPEQELLRRKRSAVAGAGLDAMLRNLGPEMMVNLKNSQRTLQDLGKVGYTPGSFQSGLTGMQIGPTDAERAGQQSRLDQFAADQAKFWNTAGDEYQEYYDKPVGPGGTAMPETFDSDVMRKYFTEKFPRKGSSGDIDRWARHHGFDLSQPLDVDAVLDSLFDPFPGASDHSTQAFGGFAPFLDTYLQREAKTAGTTRRPPTPGQAPGFDLTSLLRG